MSQMCPKVSERPMRTCEGDMLSVKLVVIKHFHCGEGNKDIVHALNFGFQNT